MHTSQPRADPAYTHDLEVATAAHDLRNRLSIAACELQQLRRRLIASQDTARTGVSDYLAAAEESLAHTNALLEGLLEVACSQPRVLVPCGDANTLDLVCVTRQIVEAQRCFSDRHTVKLVCNVARLAGAWDATRLGHLVRNLVTNAILYSPCGGEVIVTVDCENGEAVLRVADHGIGIPASDLPRVFEPFFRARNAEHLAPGLGLGLATARLIVEQYGGLLEVESIYGQGSAFTARLPLTTP